MPVSKLLGQLGRGPREADVLNLSNTEEKTPLLRPVDMYRSARDERQRDATGVTEARTEAELRDRVRQLEADVASLRQLNSPQAGQARTPSAAASQADLELKDFRAGEDVNVAGRDMYMYVTQLQERVRFLEGLDRAHRTRRFFFALSALALIVALVSATYVFLRINDLVWSAQPGNEEAFADVFNETTSRAVAVGAIAQVLAFAFFIMGLFSRSPRYR
jgi:hypothetical protein